MPRMDDWETLTALCKLATDIPVILASGYDKALVMAGDNLELPQVFIGKPYKLKELGDAIGQAPCQEVSRGKIMALKCQGILLAIGL
jgi:FixJ family two-component response regulator